MDQDLFSQFFYSEPKKEPQKTKQTKKTKEFTTLCNYNIIPDEQLLNVDDFDFKFKKGFLDRLAKLYDKVKKDGESYAIDNVTAVVSPKLFIRDILTEYTVKNIFDIQTQNQLIHIINRIMTSLYDQFYKATKIKLYFVYRGGNILKMYKKTFEDILPGVSRKLFQKEFDPFFKNSDLDFYTVVEGSEGLSKKEIYAINDYIQMMCYYGLYVARIFIMNNFQLFEYCKFNKIQIDKDFKEILKKMEVDKMESEFEEIKNTNFVGLGFNEYMYLKKGYQLNEILNLSEKKRLDDFVPSFGGDTGDKDVFENYKKFRISGRSDLNITPEETITKINPISYNQPNLLQDDFVFWTKELVNKNKLLSYYITNNNEIYNKEEYIDFSLVRMMINFTLVYERKGKIGMTNAPSELYDLSIGQPDDKMYKVYNSDNIIPFEFEYGMEGDKSLTDTIYIPSIQTTILDLIFILFEYRDFPWEDPKYGKRLYRLLVLIFVTEMSKNNLSQMEKMLKSNAKRKSRDDFDNTFETILYRNEEVKSKARSIPLQKKKLDEYLIRFEEIREKLGNVIKKLKKFDSANKKVEKNQIYEYMEQ
jgi:hypothetical protein